MGSRLVTDETWGRERGLQRDKKRLFSYLSTFLDSSIGVKILL